MEKKKKKKWKDVRSALVMVLVMAAMMSTATYAWFTMTSNPTVTGMQMVASAGTGLSVSNSVNEAFVNAVEIKMDAANMNLTATDPKRLLQLVPVSLGSNDSGATPIGFCEPEYDANGMVTSLKRNAGTLVTLGDDELVGKVAKYTYYIRSESGNVGVGILMGNATQSNESGVNGANQATAEGTFVRNRKDSTDVSVKEAYGAVRIGLVVTQADNLGGYSAPDLSTMIILEPNNDYKVGTTDITSANVELNTGLQKPGGGNYSAGDYAESIVASKVVANSDGQITTYQDTTDNKQTKPLFTVGETPKQVTMYIWLEGTDSECVDQIKTDEMEAQIQFVGLDATTTESNVPY